MSATQLAAFIAACVVAGGLAALATVVVWRLRPTEDNLAPGILALALGIFACVVFGLGTATANHDPNAPVGSTFPGCQPGTYDNGGESYNGPVCIPWPSGSGR